METKVTRTRKPSVTRSTEEILKDLNSTPASIKKYKALLGYGYDANDPNCIGNRITAEDVAQLVAKKLVK